MLNLKSLDWDPELLRLFGVPLAMLPRIIDSVGDFGKTDAALFGAEIPILGVAGDQQAASIGQACFAPGDVKATYGTGCFVLVNTGAAIAKSKNRLLSTALYRVLARARPMRLKAASSSLARWCSGCATRPA